MLIRTFLLASSDKSLSVNDDSVLRIANFKALSSATALSIPKRSRTPIVYTIASVDRLRRHQHLFNCWDGLDMSLLIRKTTDHPYYLHQRLWHMDFGSCGC